MFIVVPHSSNLLVGLINQEFLLLLLSLLSILHFSHPPLPGTEGLLVGVILRFGVHVPPSMSDVVLSCAVNASPATLLVNVSGRFYEYTLKGEVSRGKGHQVQDDEMLRKASG